MNQWLIIFIALFFSPQASQYIRVFQWVLTESVDLLYPTGIQLFPDGTSSLIPVPVLLPENNPLLRMALPVHTQMFQIYDKLLAARDIPFKLRFVMQEN